MNENRKLKDKIQLTGICYETCKLKSGILK